MEAEAAVPLEARRRHAEEEAALLAASPDGSLARVQATHGVTEGLMRRDALLSINGQDDGQNDEERLVHIHATFLYAMKIFFALV